MLNDITIRFWPPDLRPIDQIEGEIIDELNFHIEMRTEDNIQAGMSHDQARADALNRFGDFDHIHQTCRRTLLGERFMLQRIQTVLTVALLIAVVFLGLQFHRWQNTQQVLLDAVTELKPPVVVKTIPENNTSDVDPTLKEIRVTYSKIMMDGSFSWSQISDETFPETTGEPEYLADKKTCVMPVKLLPGKKYEILLNSEKFKNFRDPEGRPAVPYLLSFKTRGEADAIPARPLFLDRSN